MCFIRYKGIYISFLIIAIALIAFIGYHYRFGYFFGGDTSLSIFTVKNLFDSFFIWNNMNYSGLVSVTSTSFGLIFYSFLTLISSIFGLKVAYTASEFLGFIGGIGLFLFLYFFIKDHNTSFFLWSIASGFIYSIACSYNFVFMALPYILLSLYLFNSAIKNKEKQHYLIYFAFVVLSISLQISIGGQAYFLPNLLFLLIFLSVLIVFISSENRRIYLKYATVAIILVILINMDLIVPTYLFVKNVGNQFFNKANFLDSAVKENNILDVFYFASLYSGHNLVISLAILFLLIVFLFGFIFLVYNLRSKEHMQFILAMFISYLVMIFFSLTINKPFGLFFNFLSNKISYLYSLRYAYSATSYIFFFIFVVIFSLAMIKLGGEIKNTPKEKRNFKVIIKILITLIFIVYSSFFIYNMVLTTNIGIGKTFFIIPNSTFKLANFINENNSFAKFNSVATFPVAYNWQFTKWYYGVNVYSSLIESPVYTGGYTYYNEIFFPISKSLYSEIGYNVDTSKVNGSLSNYLGVFGIRYIIVQGNAINCKNCYEPPFNFTDIYSNINKSHNIIFVKKFGNSSLYKNNNYVKFVYTSDIINLENASAITIFDIIKNASFNIHDISVYSTEIPKFYNDSNTINATPIPNFSKPSISFVEDTPTKVTVHVSNATTPYYLVFRETYDPHWAAFYSNGTEVNPRDHIAVNGFANAWYMNKTGNYTITLYYTLQTDAWIAWGVSFAALFVTIGIGIYGWKETRKRR